MAPNPYRALPLEALYEVLAIAVRDMFEAYESNKASDVFTFKELKIQVKILLELIEQKKKNLVVEV